MFTKARRLFAQNSPLNNFAQRSLLLGILLLAFGLRVYAIDASSLWSDEGNTWALLARSFEQIAVDAAADIHPPGYYWLLKIWSSFVGRSAAALRLFSAFAGTLLVLFVYRMGRFIVQKFLCWDSHFFFYGFFAALLVALNPFQIYYSQEARMYMLLALAGTMLMLAFLQIINDGHIGAGLAPAPSECRGFAPTSENPARIKHSPIWAYGLYLLGGIIGLWTHYSFPIVLGAVGIAFLIDLVTDASRGWAKLWRFALVNLLVIGAYLPWLPTAIERVLNWPKGGETVALGESFNMILRTFISGPIHDFGQVPIALWQVLSLGAALTILGFGALFLAERRKSPQRTQLAATTLGLWLFLPIVTMLVFGLFSEAFLKFLLVAAPAWSLLIAAVPFAGVLVRSEVDARVVSGACVLVVGLIAAIWSVDRLSAYYGNPQARDNYAAVARYVDAVAEPNRSVVLLNAPGQQEVWQYYQERRSSPLPTLALPTEQPIDEEATVQLMAEQLPAYEQVFALFWATDESDPNDVIEGWLDQHAFKSMDSWQGNLRFARYDLATNLACRTLGSAATFGAEIELVERCLADGSSARLSAGEPLLLGLRWQTRSKLGTRYKTTIQLLNERNQVVAQRDSEPGGGSLPTDTWQPNRVIADNYGIMVPFGTPPGSYRLIAALYDAETGARLPTETGDHIGLGAVEIVRPNQTVPAEIVPMGVRVNRSTGIVDLAGYDVYRKGFAHTPQAPINVGDLVHVTLYWQTPDPLPNVWSGDLHFTLKLGDQSVWSPLVGGGYPTRMWQAGELVRGEFDILYDGSAEQIVLHVGAAEIRLRPILH